MKNLNKFVEHTNAIRAMFNDPPLNLNKLADMQLIYDQLDNALSPENLCCDGELRGQALLNKRKYLTSAMSELEALAEKNGVALVAYAY